MKAALIIMGIAPCLEVDLSMIQPLAAFDFMAIGVDCSDRLPDIDIQHMATYHTHEIEQFKIRRKRAGGNLDFITHSQQKPADRIWPLVAPSPLSGSSSFLGAQAGVGMGYKKIILCGCPMTGPNNNPNKKSRYDTFQKGWEKFAPTVLQDKVRSMSGWTRDFLGYPTEEWLNDL